MVDYSHHNDPDAALLDHTLRQMLTTFPDDRTAGDDLPPEALARIQDAIDRAWPDGHPPTAAELAAEDGEVIDDWADAAAHHGFGGTHVVDPLDTDLGDHHLHPHDDPPHEHGHHDDGSFGL